MPTREDMHSLAQEITGSYETRLAGIAVLRQDVIAQRRTARAQRREMGAAHRTMAQHLRTDLARGRAGLASAAIAQLEDLGAAHRTMAQHLRADLGKGRVDLTTGVGAQLKEIHHAHQAMARQQRARLDDERSHLAKGVATLRGGLHAAHQTMAQHLRADLAKGPMVLAHAESRRKSEVGTWMKGVATGRAGARKEWQILAQGMEARRAGPRPAGQAATLIAGEDDSEGEAESAARLTHRTLDYMANHPNGTRLADIERELGVGRFQMVGVIKHLMDQGAVEKRELLYFAT